MQEIIIYTDPGNTIHVDVRLEEESLWLTQVQLAELFNTTKQNISLHIARIYKDQELEKKATVKKYLTVQKKCNWLMFTNVERLPKRSLTDSSPRTTF